jgi:hypothetical protein
MIELKKFNIEEIFFKFLLFEFTLKILMSFRYFI